MQAFSKSLGTLTLLFSITAIGTLPSTTILAEETPVLESDVVTVDIVGITFSPQVQTIKAGQTVRWVNTTKFVHTVTSDATLARDPAKAFPFS